MSPLDVDMIGVQSKPVNNMGDFNQLMSFLRTENEVEFLQKIDFIAKNKSEDLPILFNAVEHNDSLLTLASGKHGSPRAVERMLHLGADINTAFSTTEGTVYPIERACCSGNWEVLKILLKSPSLDLSKSMPLLSIVVKNWVQNLAPKHNYEKCFRLLLHNDDRNKHIDINQLDADGCSALHYAVTYDNSDAILELLKHGAYIGQKSKYNQYPISKINPEVLEKYFDLCVTTNGDHFRDGEDGFELQFDYKCLVPPCDQNVVHPNEMIAIEFISESNDLRHLIAHPLITSFLFLKWNRFSIFFYTNLILSLLFAGSAAAFILIYERLGDLDSEFFEGNPIDEVWDKIENEFTQLWKIQYIIGRVTFCLIIYIIVREISQFRLSPWTYLRSIMNYMEWTMIALVLILMFDYEIRNILDSPTYRSISSIAILFIGIEVFHLMGSLPFWSLSTHYTMLKTVICTFLKSITLYSVLLLSFSLSFFILQRSKKISFIDESHKSHESEKKNKSVDMNSFSNIHMSIIKTLVMSNGEFGISEIDFKDDIWGPIMFIVFIFVISTILFNLLTGLAINDIQTIQSNAEVTYFIEQCQALHLYEKTLLHNGKWYSKSILILLFGYIFGYDAISILTKLSPHYRIGIRKNQQYQITVPKEDHKIEPILYNSAICCFGQYLRMNEKIVKLAFGILEKNDSKKNNELKWNSLRCDIIKINEKLKNLTASIDCIKNILLKQI